MIQCRVDITRSSKKQLANWNDTNRMEWQANRLSSAILMPKQMVIAVAQRAEHIYYRANDILEAVVSTFNVSKEAALYRLQDLGFFLMKEACSF